MVLDDGFVDCEPEIGNFGVEFGLLGTDIVNSWSNICNCSLNVRLLGTETGHSGHELPPAMGVGCRESLTQSTRVSKLLVVPDPHGSRRMSQPGSDFSNTGGEHVHFRLMAAIQTQHFAIAESVCSIERVVFFAVVLSRHRRDAV